jgi:hypothetical protein
MSENISQNPILGYPGTITDPLSSKALYAQFLNLILDHDSNTKALAAKSIVQAGKNNPNYLVDSLLERIRPKTSVFTEEYFLIHLRILQEFLNECSTEVIQSQAKKIFAFLQPILQVLAIS